MSTTILWFRRDLRIADNAILQYAVRLQQPILGVFVWHELSHHNSRQQQFITQSLADLKQQLAGLHIPLRVLNGLPEAVLPKLAQHHAANHLVCAEEYTPAAIDRDNRTGAALMQTACQMHSVCDHVILPKSSVMTPNGRPYTIFAPYRQAWLAHYAQLDHRSQDPGIHAHIRQYQQSLPRHLQVAFDLADENPALSEYDPIIDTGGSSAAQQKWHRFQQNWHNYPILRDFPARRATSQLAAHLRFGTLSIRQLAHTASVEAGEAGQLWLNQLIFRDFYHQFYYHFPHALSEAYQSQYSQLAWHNDPAHLHAWQTGQTGYPLIDAAMRCLKQTGFMHHRLRMVCASFLCKDLLCDWRHGAAWFAQQLTDYDCALNTGAWQAAAHCDGDIQAPFRHINPTTQSQKFDPDGRFIRRHIPELAHFNHSTIHTPSRWAFEANTHGYPEPIVQHATQREAALALYRRAQNK